MFTEITVAFKFSSIKVQQTKKCTYWKLINRRSRKNYSLELSLKRLALSLQLFLQTVAYFTFIDDILMMFQVEIGKLK